MEGAIIISFEISQSHLYLFSASIQKIAINNGYTPKMKTLLNDWWQSLRRKLGMNYVYSPIFDWKRRWAESENLDCLTDEYSPTFKWKPRWAESENPDWVNYVYAPIFKWKPRCAGSENLDGVNNVYSPIFNWKPRWAESGNLDGVNYVYAPIFNPIWTRGGWGQICPHRAKMCIPVKNQWVEILIIFVHS